MKKLLIIGHHFPEPKSSAAGSRMLQIIDCFQSNNYSITFACVSAKNENAFDLLALGIEEVSIQLNDSSFDTFIKQLNPNSVLFDRFMTEEQFGWRVAELCPDALRILDTEDLHGLRKGRHQAIKDKSPFNTSYLFNDTAKREIASIYRCDVSLIISEAEMVILKNGFKLDTSLLYYLPFLLDTISEDTQTQLPKFNDRQHFITIGNFIHEPNYDAVRFLKQTIWPLIRKQLPTAEMHIYGAYASQKVAQLHNMKDGFIIKSFVDDVNTVMQDARICLAPLRFGAGLKGKLVDAMQNGLPCVMSSIAAEGMFGELEANGLVVDAPEAFANHAVELYNSDAVWNTKQSHGFKIINTRFNRNDYQNDFINTLEALKSDLSNHRLQNFTGQMLQHQTMQATKYMSKWIEEKNRD